MIGTMTNTTEAAEMTNPAAQPAPRLVSVDGKIHCRKFEVCGNWVNPGTKTGRCQPCVREMWHTGELSHPATRDPRKKEVEFWAGRVGWALRHLFEKALEEDPGRGLAAMLKLENQVSDLANAVGEAVTEQFGVTVVAQELGRGTKGKTGVDNRWGEGARTKRAIDRGECTCHTKPRSRDQRPVQTGDRAACVYHRDREQA